MERDPAAVLQAAIRGVVDRLPDTVKDDKEQLPEFQQARYFTGSQKGYYFGTGEQGTGYYLDPTLLPKSEDTGTGKQAVDAEDLLREAEEQANISEVQLLDAKSMRRHVTAFDRKYKENQEMRIKYADQPEKFMESELDLDEEVQRLLAVAGSPELYPDFVKTGVVENLMNLLSHENTDIAADVLELFQQLTDADIIEDSEEEAQILVDDMIEHNGLEMLVHRLTALVENSDDERKAVFNTLSIFENMIEVKPEVAEWVLERTKLLKWLLGRLRPREFDSNKQYTSELLAILIQNSAKNQQQLADVNGIDALLQAIAPYKGRNPGSIDEEEFLENLFNCLCACLMTIETRSLFQKAEGTELMLLILKQKRIARAGALKALDFATTKSPGNCERFVDQLGLKTIFAMFMGKVKLKRKKGADAEEMEDEERALSVVANLFQGLSRGSRRDRLAAKFVENEFEKCDRLVEFFDRYQRRVQIAEAEAGSESEVDEEAKLISALEQGIYTLHQCALIIGHLWFVGDLGVRKRILQLLHQRGHSLTDVRNALTRFMESIGDEGNKTEAEKERKRVQRMLQALGEEAQKPSENGLEPKVEAQSSQPAPVKAEPKPEAMEVKAEPLDQKSSSSSSSGSSDSGSSSSESTPPPPTPSNPPKDLEPANGHGRKKESRADFEKEEGERHREKERDRQRDRDKERERERDRRGSDRQESRHRDERHRRDSGRERERERRDYNREKRHRDREDEDRRDRKRDRR